MDVRLIGTFRLGALFRRQTGSVEKVVPIPKQIGFTADHVVRADVADVFQQYEAVTLGSGAFWPPERLPNAVLTGLGCML
jgi:hypothetical protein